jgi:glycosyltransferase involved in cell wall biosynthesis
MRVLFLSPVPPWPARSGGRVRTQRLLCALRARADVRVLAVEDPALRDSYGRPDVAAHCALFPRSRPPALARLLRPRASRWFHSGALDAAVRDALATGTEDVIHLDEPLQLDALPQPCPVPLVVHHHKLDRELAAATGVALHERLRLGRLERRAAAATPHHVVCAEEDARRLRARHPALVPAVVPNGVDPPAPGAPPERDARTLLFLGSLDYAPNLDALALLTSELWPRLAAARPDLTLRIVGARPTAAARRLARGPRVELVGEVADAREEFARATLLLAPLRIGGGSRLKIPEALAQGCPVVATPVAAEGLGLAHGRHLSLARDVRGLAAACLDLLDDPAGARAQASAGRAAVLRRLTWPRLAGELLRVWQRAAGG